MTTTQRATQAYEVRPIDPLVVSRLREADDAGLAPRISVDAAGGSPLRCCLRKSHPGERVALVAYAPLRGWALETGADPGPYDEVGPVFIHPEHCSGYAGSGFPEAFTGARRVLRCYSSDGRIIGGRLAEPDQIRDPAAAGRLLSVVFADPEVALVHARALEFGCFTFEIRRR